MSPRRVTFICDRCGRPTTQPARFKGRYSKLCALCVGRAFEERQREQVRRFVASGVIK